MKNNCTFLEKLLDGAEVEWETLDEVFHLKNGYTPSKGIKEYWENGSIPWFRMEDIRENGRILNTALQKVSESAVKGGKLFPANSIIIATSATIGEHALITIPFLANQRFTVLSLKPEYIDKFNIYFLYHYCFTLDDWCQKNTTMSSFASVDMNGFRRFPIPIPPLPVQTEIVKILDALTALTSELTSELILRRKQYEYYREKLLSFDSLELSGGAIQWIKLIDLGELIRGNGLQKKDFTETGVPAIHYGQIYTYYGTFATETKSFVSAELAKKLKKAKYGDVLIAGTSENVKDVMKPLGWLGSEIAFSGDMFAFRPNKKVNTKYLTYVLQTERFYKFKEKYAQGTKVIRIRVDNFLNYEIPLPPFEEQQRIVSILDKFETLTNSITEGLPLAIKQSQKRYEYYRELLLNFS
ncbi:restriction endonuclease subunit S [Aggregatibacter kilianii]|uniref:restriction endonuclease subunit S n=1 Tax=Aggregatibacter kilianii TaxID=2025884 RepID=UPI000D655792|nr:restriction endonuclease subunit S [Aggregatibacter kilianii]